MQAAKIYLSKLEDNSNKIHTTTLFHNLNTSQSSYRYADDPSFRQIYFAFS